MVTALMAMITMRRAYFHLIANNSHIFGGEKINKDREYFNDNKDLNFIGAATNGHSHSRHEDKGGFEGASDESCISGGVKAIARASVIGSDKDMLGLLYCG